MLSIRKNQRGDVVAIAIISVAFIVILALCFWAIVSSKSRSKEILDSKSKNTQRVETKPSGEPLQPVKQ